MKNNHTPGPWVHERNTVAIPVYNDKAGAELITLNLSKTHSENEANARLIASAPDLLKALELAQRELQWMDRNALIKSRAGGDYIEVEHLEYINQVIKQATGNE